MPNPAHTLSQLTSLFLAWLEKEVTAGRNAARTIDYYRGQLERFVVAAGGERPVEELRAFDLEKHKTGWHSVQAVQRLFNWAVEAELVEHNPFRRIKRPPLGERQRILTPGELVRLLRAARPHLRRFLIAQLLSLGRPQELRAVRWHEYRTDHQAFVLTDFKGKKRRKDGKRVRVLPVVGRLARLLRRLASKNPDQMAHVFLNSKGLAWTANALRLAMRYAAARAQLNRPGLERVVAYTIRHTAATRATSNGVRDRLLADIMGHVDTRTTSRYQHLQVDDLVAGAHQASKKRRAS